MRTTAILSALTEKPDNTKTLSEEKSQDIELTNNFTCALNSEKFVANARSPYIYKAGTPFEAEIYLESKPRSAKDYLNFALSYFEHKINLFDLPYFADKRMDISLFSLSLILDTANAGYKPARELIITILQEGKHGLNADDVNTLLKLRGYRLAKNKDGRDQLYFWSAAKAPQNLADLKQFVKTLIEQGPISKDYILVQPRALSVLISKTNQQIMSLKNQLKEQIHQYHNTLVGFAKEGKTVELERDSAAMIKAAEEGGYNPIELRLLKESVEKLTRLNKPQEATKAPTPLKESAVENMGNAPAIRQNPIFENVETRDKCVAVGTFFKKALTKSELDGDDSLSKEMGKENDLEESFLVTVGC